MEELSVIKSILDDILGEPKHDYCGSGGWYEYPCPFCKSDNFGEDDGKYNFAVKLSEGEGMWGHCWKCEHHASLYNIVKMFGSRDQLEMFKNEVDTLTSKHFYEIKSGDYVLDGLVDLSDKLELPEQCRNFTDKCVDCEKAVEYLKSRGIGPEIIERFNIKYINGEWVGDFSLRNRIVIPSYDRFGELNYWVARDFTGTNKYKIKNPQKPKTEFVFNEFKINWYEPITLVEGPFDHIVVPNSIPLLGKTMNKDSAVYKTLVEYAENTVNIMLDDDAVSTALRLYKFLNNTVLKGRIRIIRMPKGYDPSDYYRDFGVKGICNLLRSASEINEYELTKI